MSADTSIRRVTIAEQARMAAERFMDTGEAQPNPHQDMPEAGIWRSAYDRYILQLSAENDAEASA